MVQNDYFENQNNMTSTPQAMRPQNNEAMLSEYSNMYSLNGITNNEMANLEIPFLHSFLSENKGKWMKLELLLGNNLVSKIGQLIKVGANFAVLKLDTNPVSTLVCDLKSVKFITIIYTNNFDNLNQ